MFLLIGNLSVVYGRVQKGEQKHEQKSLTGFVTILK